MNSLPSLEDAVWSESFGTRARPTAIAIFTGLDETTRQSVEARVLADRPRWRTHDERGTSPFYTLGSPTYIRGGQPLDDETQQHLRYRYHDAHQRLVERLRVILDAPVALSERDSAPGFHIFKAAAGVSHGAVGMHLDAQFRHLAELETTPTAIHSSDLISATMVIRADGGAGLDYVARPHIPGVAMQTEPVSHVAYQPGQLVLQFGLFSHSVAAFGGPNDNTIRITLQAHGVRTTSGAWRLYW